ncbi:MAG: glycosyltransferase family 4 protein [Betaproteobacteria bacterium]|nr:glycosyltransferase family 4 protein [Betaproteobacteria bacterium]
MKIAFVDVTTTVFFGGIQTAVWELARSLHDLGHEVTVYGGEGPVRPDLGGRAITVRTFPFTPRERVLDLGSRFRRIVERWSFARHALPALAAEGVDWVILTKPFDFFWPWRMPKGSRTRFCFMSGGTDFFRGDRILARRLDAWAACSHFNAWQVAHRYKTFPRVIYNGVDTDAFAPRPRPEAARARLGFAPEDVVFAFAGRMVGWKGLAVALRALAEPPLAGVPARLLLIGDGDARPGLERLAASLGVAERVRFHAAVPHRELPDLYALADAGVFPSIGDEAFGITIAEAMACGLPVIASHIGGIPEVVGNEGNCGLLAAPGDPRAWAEAMAGLAQDPERRRILGAAGAERIRRLYTWEASARRLLATLEGA